MLMQTFNWQHMNTSLSVSAIVVSPAGVDRRFGLSGLTVESFVSFSHLLINTNSFKTQFKSI